MSARRLFVVGTALVAGCAMTPEANNALESARSTYRMALADPQVNLHAPVELQVAQRSLGQAENMWNAGGDPEVVAHLAYLAEQRSRIAMTRDVPTFAVDQDFKGNH